MAGKGKKKLAVGCRCGNATQFPGTLISYRTFSPYQYILHIEVDFKFFCFIVREADLLWPKVSLLCG